MLVDIGTVSKVFLFTDVEGSTSRWEKDETAMRAAMARHDGILRRAVTAAGGRIFKTTGDGLCAAFPQVPAALDAARDGQASLLHEDFSAVGGIQVRMAIHVGDVEARDDDYFGRTLNLVARLLAACHGGQVVLSEAAAEQALHCLPEFGLRDLGRHRLKDLMAPERVFQLVAPPPATEFPALRSLDSMPNNLPQQATSFVGRSEELAELGRLIERNRLVTMLGSGGLGKSRLSLQLGAHLLGRFADGVWLIELAPLTRPAQIAEAVAAALGIIGPEINNDMVVTYLKYQRLMLILDNCEHLVEGVAALADAILKACPGVTLLTTSRETLLVAGEQIYPVPTLGVPDQEGGLTLDDALDHASIRLFADRAALVVPDFRLDAGNAPAIGAICRRLDGIALAIELAAARIALLTPAELLARLHGRFDILSGGSRTALPRQQTLYATIAWSFDLLGPDEQSAVCRLAVFEGSFSLGPATEVVAAAPIAAALVFDLIAALAGKSMISRLAQEDGESRYRMLDTTRQFCLERLAERGETDATRKRLALAMAALYRRAWQEWATRYTPEWVACYAPDQENLSASVEFAFVTDPALALEMVGLAEIIGHATSSTSFLLRWYDMAEAVIGPATPALDEARIRSGAARIRQFGSGANVAGMTRALELFRTLGDTREEALCLSFLVWAPYYDGKPDPDFQKACMAQVRPMLEWLKPDKYRASILRGVAHALEADEAAVLIEEALTIATATGYRNMMLWARNSLALNSFARGDLPQALELSRQGAEQCHDLSDKWLRGAFLCDTLAYACISGRYAEARAAAPGAFENFRALDNRIGVGWTIERVALLAACEGRLQEAALLAGYCEVAFRTHRWATDPTQGAVRARLRALLEAGLTPEERDGWMRTGGGWSDDHALEMALVLTR